MLVNCSELMEHAFSESDITCKMALNSKRPLYIQMNIPKDPTEKLFGFLIKAAELNPKRKIYLVNPSHTVQKYIWFRLFMEPTKNPTQWLYKHEETDYAGVPILPVLRGKGSNTRRSSGVGNYNTKACHRGNRKTPNG